MSRWELSHDAAFRVTGFPFELVGLLRTTATADRLRRLSELDRFACAYRDDLLGRAFPEAVSRARTPEQRRWLSRARRDVGRGRMPADTDQLADAELADCLSRWVPAVAAVAGAEDAVRAAWTSDASAISDALRATCDNPRLIDALQRMSGSFATQLGRYRREHAGRRSRATERRLALYLQRLATKNETNSFFGPVGRARVGSGDGERLRLRGKVGAGAPVVFATVRLAQGLGDVAARHQVGRLHTPVRPHPMAVASELTDADERHVFEAADGQRTVAEIAAATGLDDGRALAAADRLAAAGLAVLGPVVGPAGEDPLSDIEQDLMRLPQGNAVRVWCEEEIAGLRTVLRRPGMAWPDRLAAVEQRWSTATGLESSQAAGHMYADRTLIFEERPSSLELELSPTLRDELAAGLGPVLDLWAVVAGQRRDRARAELAGLFERCWPGRESVPLRTYLAAAARLARSGSPGSADRDSPGPALRAIAEEIQRQREAGADVVRISADRLRQLVGQPSERVFSSVDVLIGAPDIDAVNAGRYRVVLGECHAPELLSVFPTDHFHRAQAPQTVAARIAWWQEAIATPGERLAYIVNARRTKIFGYPPPAVPIELRPARGRAGAVPARDVRVHRDDDGFALHDPHGRLTLLPALHIAPGFDPLLPFSLPPAESVALGEGDAVPRIEIGTVCVQRARVTVTLPPEIERAAGADRMLLAWRWGARLGLGERVFARSAAEPKPVYIDFASPPLVDVLARMGSGGATLQLSELLPGTDELWLAGPDGRHTAELRMLAVCRSGGTPA